MAKGTLVFEFETALDLENQMRAYLRMPLLQEVTLGEAEHASATAQDVLGVNGDGMSRASFTTKSSLIEKVYKSADQVDEERHASRLPAVDALPQAAPTTDEKAVGVVDAEPRNVGKEEKPPKEQNAPSITLENLGTAPYPELLAFCKSNPGVGLDVSKCQHEYFRKMVEIRIKTFLETK